MTDRGRPVALLSPLPDTGPLKRLRVGGEVSLATGYLNDLPLPLSPDPGQDLPSAVLARLREDER